MLLLPFFQLHLGRASFVHCFSNASGVLYCFYNQPGHSKHNPQGSGQCAGGTARDASIPLCALSGFSDMGLVFPVCKAHCRCTGCSDTIVLDVSSAFSSNSFRQRLNSMPSINQTSNSFHRWPKKCCTLWVGLNLLHVPHPTHIL